MIRVLVRRDGLGGDFAPLAAVSRTAEPKFVNLARLWRLLSASWILSIAILAYLHFSSPDIDLPKGWESVAEREAAARIAHPGTTVLQKREKDGHLRRCHGFSAAHQRQSGAAPRRPAPAGRDLSGRRVAAWTG
jgi:hypothetical protein